MSFAPGGLAVVVGASGGIGAALVQALQNSAQFVQVLGLSRRSAPALDLLDEASIANCAQHVQGLQLPLRCVFDATGMLHAGPIQPEKTWQQLDAAAMAQAFAINAIGPALLMKHFLPLLVALGARADGEAAQRIAADITHSVLSMESYVWGLPTA